MIHGHFAGTGTSLHPAVRVKGPLILKPFGATDHFSSTDEDFSVTDCGVRTRAVRKLLTSSVIEAPGKTRLAPSLSCLEHFSARQLTMSSEWLTIVTRLIRGRKGSSSSYQCLSGANLVRLSFIGGRARLPLPVATPPGPSLPDQIAVPWESERSSSPYCT